MDNNYRIAAGGLKMIRTSMILSVVVVLLTFLTGIAALGLIGASLADNGGAALGAAGISLILLIAMGVLAIVSLVMQLVGLGKTTGAHGGYKTAMLIVVVNIIVSLVGSFMKNSSPMIYNLATVASVVLTFLVAYLIITATMALLGEKGDEETAAKGVSVRTIYLICAVVNLATLLVAFFPAFATMALVLLIVSSVAQLVAFFMYIGFLGHSVQSLNA